MNRYILIVIMICFAISQISFLSSATLVNAADLPQKTIDTENFPNGMIKTKKVQFPNGDQYLIKRVEFSGNGSGNYIITVPFEGTNGTFRYVEARGTTKVWRHLPLAEKLPKAVGFLESEQSHMLISAPVIFKKNMHGTLEEQPNSLPTRIERTAKGYQLHIQFPQKQDTIAEIWWLQSKERLVDWASNPFLSSIWMGLDMQTEQKWSWDGMYQKIPQSYTPYSPHMYWRIPINYVAASFVGTGGSRAADDLGWMMLDTILPNQNKDGYWETKPRSGWLWKDYKIDAGFYDTRFNTDMGVVLLKGYQKYGDQSFYQATQMYAAWLLEHADESHYTIPGDKEGWLVPDYSHKEPHVKTHVSLNHQLQEINYLYKMYLESNQEFYKETANKMLQGIKNTKTKWIKPDKDLHYAYLPNGKMGLLDYPYLTYNDLVETQTLLLKLNGAIDPDLTYLMASKKAWMDSHGVKGYRPAPL